ncbi:MAG: GAF domain-containing protein, partial [Desulfosudaceae bacterium]
DHNLDRRFDKIRLSLIEYAPDHNLAELLTRALDEVTTLVDSRIGFYHFISSDQKEVHPQQWSSRTREEFCRVRQKARQKIQEKPFDLTRAGIWADCVSQKKPVVHNDYAALPRKKGLPPGHAEIIRELVVPVTRRDRVMAILGVGNKSADYTRPEVDLVARLADVTWTIIHQKRTEQALRQSEAKFYKVFHTSPYAIILTRSRDGKILEVNQTFTDVTGFTKEEAIGRSSIDLNLWVNESDRKQITTELLQGKTVDSREFMFNTRNRGLVTALLSAHTFSLNEELCVLTSLQDITAHKQTQAEKDRLEEQIQQSRKLESIGRLAGGIAHDFNNLLSPILGYGEILLAEEDITAAQQTSLREIVKAGQRARDLVQQILAFGRKQTLAFTSLNLNELLENFINLLLRAIREDIAIEMNLAPSLPDIRGDAGQVEQIIMNLAVNAQDAMPRGGRLIITTATVELDDDYAGEHPAVTPGPHVLLTISDTGCGMDAATCANVFEPFFTTKEVGHGSGMGLATVYGIVKQHEGNIWVYSEPGLGSTFKIYLPVSSSTDRIRGQEPDLPPDISGTETILLVEDSQPVRMLANDILQDRGYAVLAAASGQEALSILRKHAGTIDLLLTDVVMPEMNGQQLFQQVAGLYPGVKVLYMSGYPDEVIAHQGLIDKNVNFIEKPFSTRVLAAKVRDILDQPRS